MRVLILDDEQYRHDVLGKRFAGAEVVEARTAPEAAQALATGARFDLAHLDHDLGDGNGTGMDVAEFIALLKPEFRPRLAIVHSFNPPGARNMVACLKAAGVPARHEPFTCGAIIGDTERP